MASGTCGPLLDQTLAFRIAGDYRTEDAYVRVRPYAELPHPERFQSKNVRGKLLYAPDSRPEIRSLLTLGYTDAYAPQTLSARRPFDDYISAATFTPRFQTRATVGISETSYQISDAIGLSAFLTASDFRVNR